MSIIARRQEGGRGAIPLYITGENALAGTDGQLVLLMVGLGQVSPIAADTAAQQVDDRDFRVGENFHRGRRCEDAAEPEARAAVMGRRLVHNEGLREKRASTSLRQNRMRGRWNNGEMRDAGRAG